MHLDCAPIHSLLTLPPHLHSHIWLFPGAEYVAEREVGSSQGEDESPELPESVGQGVEQGGDVAS